MGTYEIIYSSLTGNTAKLAETIQGVLPEDQCSYYGKPNESAGAAAILFVGFWTDKGTGDEPAMTFLKSIHHKKVFLFGTAGSGTGAEYFSGILDRITSEINPDNEVIGTFMCQGKMEMGLRKRFEAMLDKDPVHIQPRIDEFDQALSHPDQKDLENLIQVIRSLNI